MVLDFNEIRDGSHFEDLVAAYFEDQKRDSTSNIIDVDVKPSGDGTDGGRDILVTFRVSDGISSFDRKWIIQCKFHERSLSTNSISDINLPSLLYSHGACGYLLVCKSRPTSRLTDLFERLENNCRYKNKYMIWTGEQFKRFILVKAKPEVVLAQFFPRYFAYYQTNTR